MLKPQPYEPYSRGWLPARAASNACAQQTDAMFDDLNECIDRAQAFRRKMDAAAAEKAASPVVRAVNYSMAWWEHY